MRLTGAGIRIAVAATATVAVSVFAASAGAGLIPLPVETEIDGRPMEVAIGRLDAGPTKDIAVASESGRNVSVLYGEGNGSFADAEAIEIDSLQGVGVAIARMNDDKRPDLVVVGDGNDPGEDRLLVLLGKQSGGFRAPKSYPLPTTSPIHLAIADLDADGRPDAVVGDSNSSALIVKYGKGDGAFGKTKHYVFFNAGPASEPQDTVIGDFDRDGFKDIAVAVGRLGAVGVLYTKTVTRDGKTKPKRGAFRKKTYPVEGAPYGIAAGDLNGDGRLDIAVPNDYNSGVESVSILYGKKRGEKAGFKAHVEADLGEVPYGGIAIGRFNPGKRLDIAASVMGGDLVYLYGQTSGGFAPHFDYTFADPAISMAASDLNGDGEDDLVVGQWIDESILVVLEED